MAANDHDGGRIVDPGRYRALVRVLGGVVGALAAIDVVLRLAFGMAPAALLRASFHDSDHRELVAGRVAAVLAEPAAPLAVIVGASSAYDGLDPSVLDGADPAHRWLNLATTGSSFDELRYTFGPLFASGLHADVVVLAVHPGWLAGRLVGDPELDAILLSSDAPRTSWLLFHRGLVNHFLSDELADARTWLLVEQLGLPFAAVHAPVSDPWTVHRRSGGGGDVAGADVQMDMWRRKRWFDASWYAKADEELAAAAGVVAAAHRVASHVVVVFMPESSALRAAMPAAAEAAFRRAVARVAAPPPILDLRAEIADDLFIDNIHLGERGARRLSETLARRLR